MMVKINTDNQDALTAEQLRQLMHYDPETGLFTWKVQAAYNVKPGHVAGTVQPNGYIRITINKRRYLASRLAHLYMTEAWPDCDIDHRDTNRSNNVWKNLRPATKSQNKQNAKLQANNRSGFKGVRFHQGAYVAQIGYKRKIVDLGRFRSAQDAHEAYAKYSKMIYGEFART